MEKCLESLVEIHPKDAKKLGIKDSQLTKVSSRYGAVQAKSSVTERVPEGTIFMTFHFREAVVNLLTNPALNPVCKIIKCNVCAVKVEAA